MALSLADTVETKARPQAWRASHDRSARAAGRHDAAGGSQAGRERFTLAPTDRLARPEAGARPSPGPKPADAKAVERPDPSASVDRPSRTERPSAKPSPAGKLRPSSGEDRTGAATVQTDDASAQAVDETAAEGEAGEAAAATASDEPAEILPGAQGQIPTPPVPMPAAQSAPSLAGQTPPSAGPPQGEAAESEPAITAGIATRAGESAAAVKQKTTETGFEAALAAIAADGTAGEAPMVASAAPVPGASQAAAPTPASETKAAAPPSMPTAAPVPLGAVPMTIGLRALGAASRFEIRLDPAELGRIDVALDIDRDSGTVGARLVVDRPETLALLQRDASSLQQALAQTGLDASAGIALSLRDDGSGERRRESGADAQPGTASRDDGSESQTAISPARLDAAPLRSLRGYGGLDIRI